MEALHSGGGQSLDFNVLTCASDGDVVGNDAQYADVHAIMLDVNGTGPTDANAVAGVTADAVAQGSGAQDAADSNVKLVLGAKATGADDAYNGQTLRLYAVSDRGLAAAKSLTGSNAPHGPKGYTDYEISAWTEATSLVTITGSTFAHGVGQDANDDVNEHGAADVLDIDYEILPGIKVTGTGNIVAVVGRLHVPQV